MKRISPSLFAMTAVALSLSVNYACLAGPVSFPAKAKPKHEIVQGIYMFSRGSFLGARSAPPSGPEAFGTMGVVCQELLKRPPRLVAGRLEDAARFEMQTYVSGPDLAAYSTTFLFTGVQGTQCDFQVIASHEVRINHYENGRTQAFEFDFDKGTSRKLPENAMAPATALDPASKAQWTKDFATVGNKVVAGVSCRLAQKEVEGVTTRVCLIDDKSLPELFQNTAISVEVRTGGTIFSQWEAEIIEPNASFDRGVFQPPGAAVPK